MTIKTAIDRWGDSAHEGLTIQVIPNHQSTQWILFVGTGAAFDFLAHLMEGFLEEEDCGFGLEPFGAGCAYFKRSTRAESSGLYFHRRPCPWGPPILGGDPGFGWLCFVRACEDVPKSERDYDPSFVVIDATSDALLVLQKLFQRMINESDDVVMSADQVQFSFGCTTPFGLQMIRSE